MDSTSIYFCSEESAAKVSLSSEGVRRCVQADSELTGKVVARGGDEAAEVERSEEMELTASLRNFAPPVLTPKSHGRSILQ